MSSRHLSLLLWLVTLAATLGLLSANLLLGDLNQDEGWYLYAARLVSQGLMPYIDFATTQGPVLPFVYVLAQPLVNQLGVAGGRLFTMLLALAGLALAAWLAARLSPRGRGGAAALLACALAGVNVYQAYFSTVVKTYALSAFLVLSGLHCLVSVTGRRPRLAAVSAAVFLGLAAATRSSAGFFLPAAFAALCLLSLAEWARAGSRLRFPWLWFAVSAAATMLAAFGPFILRAPQGVWFALVEYHAGRETGSLFTQLVYKAGFAARLVRAYLAAAIVLAGAGAYALARRRPAAPRDVQRRWLGALWGGVGLVTLVHFLAPFPYDDYQVFLFPILAVCIATLVVRLVPGPDAMDRATVFVVLCCLLTAGGSPRVQDWFVGPRDRIWWPLKQRTPLQSLRAAAREIVPALAARGGELLTQDTYLAVEAGLNVPRGMELGPFSYFPEWSRGRAAARHVLNREMLAGLLATCTAPAAAFSGYGLAIRCPQVDELPAAEQERLWDAVAARYAVHCEVPDFGQAGTTLRILARRRP